MAVAVHVSGYGMGAGYSRRNGLVRNVPPLGYMIVDGLNGSNWLKNTVQFRELKVVGLFSIRGCRQLVKGAISFKP